VKHSEKNDIVSRSKVTIILALVPFECDTSFVPNNNQTKGQTMATKLGFVQRATLVAMRLSGCRWNLRGEWFAGPSAANHCKTVRILDKLEARGLVKHAVLTHYELTDEGVKVADESRTVPNILAEATLYLAGENRLSVTARRRPVHIVTGGSR